MSDTDTFTDSFPEEDGHSEVPRNSYAFAEREAGKMFQNRRRCSHGRSWRNSASPGQAFRGRGHQSRPTDPLSVPGIVRILLSEKAGAALVACGAWAFVVVSRGFYPDSHGRMVIYCSPCPFDVARDACGIIAGTHRAQRIKTPVSGTATPAKSEVPAIVPDCPPDAPQGNHGPPRLASTRRVTPVTGSARGCKIRP